MEQHESYVIHTRPYLETSFIVELFSKELGRHSALAKGVRRGQDARRGILQPFVPLWVAFRGKRELPTLWAVEGAGPSFLLKAEHLIAALYMNELLYRLLPKHDAVPLLFEQYHRTLQALAGTEDPYHWQLRHFECSLLKSIGFGIDFHRDTNGRFIEAGRYYRYQRELGFIAQIEPQGFSGNCLLALSDLEAPSERTLFLEAKQVMRTLLALHIPTIHSRALFY